MSSAKSSSAKETVQQKKDRLATRLVELIHLCGDPPEYGAEIELWRTNSIARLTSTIQGLEGIYYYLRANPQERIQHSQNQSNDSALADALEEIRILKLKNEELTRKLSSIDRKV